MKPRQIVDEMDSYVPGRSQDEIAAEFGISENKVKYETQKVLNLLKTLLKDYDDFSILIILILTGLS